MIRLYKLWGIMLAVLLCATIQAAGIKDSCCYNPINVAPAPPLEICKGQGISAPFAGNIEGQIIVAGGCNFPEVAAASGGQKHFYDDVFLLNESRWINIGKLPQPVAYGISVSMKDGIACIGGQNSNGSLAEAFIIRMQNGKPSFEQLPPLPVALDNAAGGYGDGFIYVCGGETNEKVSHRAFRLNMSHPTAWEALPDFPGRGRLQACGCVMHNGFRPCFYVMGGYCPMEGHRMAVVHKDGLCFDPNSKKWHSTAPFPKGRFANLGLSGSALIQTGSTHMMAVGGVDSWIFGNTLNIPFFIHHAWIRGDHELANQLERVRADYMYHNPDWYRFNTGIFVYNTITDTWVVRDSIPSLARAGAALVKDGKDYLCVNGELMPGIRSAEVNRISIETPASFGWLNWAVIIVYLLGMLMLGWYFMHRAKDSNDFFKGGGRIPWWAAGISLYATMLSAITYMAIPAKAYATDWTYYPMLITILIMAFPVIKYYLPFFRRLNVTSAYEYLEQRFNYATRALASCLFILFMIARMALVLYLPSLALTTVTGIDIYTCIILMGIITIIYCTMGGAEAVIWGDVIQGIILVGGALLAAGYLMFATEGGVGGFFDIAWHNDKFRLFDWSLDYTKATFWVVILGGLANNLISYTSDQTVVQRYLTTKDEKSAGHSIMVNGLMSAFVSIVFYLIGTGLYTFYKTHPAELDMTMTNSDSIFPFFMMTQLPSGIAGLLIAAIFAAAMSTIASNINSVATAYSIDFHKRFTPNMTEAKVLHVARRASIVSGILGVALAILMATWNIFSLLDYFNTILGLLSGGLGGLFIMGIFFDRINGKAALIGFLAGTITVFILNFFTPVSFLIFGAINMAVSVGTAWIISRFCPQKQAQSGLTWKQLNNNN